MTHRTRIKICGITRPEDAAVAAECGADAIGLNFHPASFRYISTGIAREILNVLPAFVTAVALFVDADPAMILSVTSELSLRHIQLHGHESPQIMRRLPGLRAIKAIRVDSNLPATLDAWRDVGLAGILLETAGTKEPGGSGVANNWAVVREHLQRGLFKGAPPVIAAGGLTAENVGGVIETIHPYAVDLSSGVESQKGIKSREKIEAFCQAVRAAR